jgi:RHS repeat-associated protein
VQDRLGSQNGKFYPYGIERPSASANDTEKFATYTRDSATGLDYALNRYHQPGYGRFLSPDPYPGSAHPGDPGSWNRYEYVEGDPTNRTDSSGLCSVIAAGITQSPSYSSTYCLQKLGLAVGGILVFDYAGGTVLSGVKDVAAQGLGNADAATIAVLNAIAVAAQTPGPIDIFAFSGGAQAFSTAMSYLNSATAARIRNVTYLSPGSAELVGPLASGTGQTTVYAGNSLIDLIIGNATPSGASFIPTGCAHDSNCLIEKVFFDLIPLGGGPCSVGAGAQSGAGEPPNIFEMLLLSQITSLVYWFPPVNPLIEKVTSTIKYQEGAEN